MWNSRQYHMEICFFNNGKFPLIAYGKQFLQQCEIPVNSARKSVSLQQCEILVNSIWKSVSLQQCEFPVNSTWKSVSLEQCEILFNCICYSVSFQKCENSHKKYLEVGVFQNMRKFASTTYTTQNLPLVDWDLLSKETCLYTDVLTSLSPF